MNNPGQESVICIHPVVEERGRIKDDNETVFTVSLKDCLACSGCAITEDEITLLSHQDPTKILQAIKENPGFSVIISTSVLANLAAAKQWSIQKAFGSMSFFFLSLGASQVVHDGFWQIVWRNLLIDEFKKAKITKPFIISRCPGAVLFFERKTKNANHLAPIKPFPQLYALHSKNDIKKPPYVLNVAPCYDRKLETGRFKGDIDGTISVGEISSMIQESDEIETFPFPNDNDAIYMVRKLSGYKEVEVKEAGHVIEYTCGNLKGALICGEASLRRLSANIDRNNCQYDIVEADFCPGSCSTGGGLIRGSNPSKRKLLVQQTIDMHKSFENEQVYESEVGNVVETLKKLQIKAEYASVETNDDFQF
ncbi:cytosolic Fe-S cluster assembly factor narfl isoform X1 [Histomonas meleagridis]|uniref:cytosolic Fe-S cluster assembly factor narfl isoform X1 n=1 Tax=Histomonas meleagridis TaxID=135588 RepID=UPI003559FF77|nr:cytosolic Fe-S cluster assembly factor narfl isoform X1 [Histomonas meleagridis]KAH0801905.1 cytosolic Fe-S cluster assembly factor narfl isoform X1 [Histomonas meleagridis]